MNVTTGGFYKRFLDDWILKVVLADDNDKEKLLIDFLKEAQSEKFSEDIIKEMLEHLCTKASVPIAYFLDKVKDFETNNKINPYESDLGNKKDDPIDWLMLAQSYLVFLKKYFGISNVRYFDQDFYFWKDGVYKISNEEEIRSLISNFICEREKKLRFKKPSVLYEEMIKALKITCFIPKLEDIPFLIVDEKIKGSSSSHQKVNWLIVRNGVIDLDETIKAKEVTLLPYNEKYFSLVKLNFNYNPRATCPIWLKILQDSLEDDERINCLQEWFGYNLINHSKHAKFLMLFGLPAAGKSVILRVLSLLIGEGNYSTISLENFDTTRSFVMSHLQGKLANLIFDSNDINKANEGVLKQFVSGEPITVERKYKNPFVMKSTAKLTIATNHELRFSDKTDSIWRRILLFHFKKNILDESKQDTRYVSNDWWQASDELPGVLNWALEGLMRLEERGHFLIPPLMAADLNIYRANNSVTSIFIDSFLCEKDDGEIPSHWLYRDYKNYCIENGYNPQNAGNFTKELKKALPTISISDGTYYVKDPRGIEKFSAKSRMIKGLSFSTFLEGEGLNN